MATTSRSARTHAALAEPKLYQIGEAADRVGLSLRALRYYEEVGLVVPSGRSPGGFRLYDTSDVERLAFVKRLKPLEFSLEEIRELLEIRDRLADPPSDRSAIDERLRTFIAAAETRSRALHEQSRAAAALAGSLRRLLRA